MLKNALILTMTLIVIPSCLAGYLKSDPNVGKYGLDVIPCPSCVGENCRGIKVCSFGTFSNEVCNNQLDCYRGPGESCGESMHRELRCRPELKCQCNVCTGTCDHGTFELRKPCLPDAMAFKKH